jgi:uncharacterized protein
MTVSEIGQNNKHNYNNLYRAVPILVFCLLAIYLLSGNNPEAAITTGFGFLFGYIFQRSRFCFAAGFRDVFMIRNTVLSRAVLLTVFLTTIGFVIVHFIKGDALPSGGIIYPLGLHTAIGGLIFGFGMVIAGNCVSGCLMRMGEGYLMQWLTFGGILLGSAIGAWHLGWWDRISIAHSPMVFLPHKLGWTLTLILQVSLVIGLYILAYFYERSWRKAPLRILTNNKEATRTFIGEVKIIFSTGSLSYSTGAVLLAFTNTLLFYSWGRPWAITGGLTHLVGWISIQIGISPYKWHYFQELIFDESKRIFLEHPLLYLSVAMIAGSLFASLLAGEFRVRLPKSIRFIISALVGGLLLGYGSRVAMGCNVGGFLGGVASLSLHGWVLALFMLLGAYLGGKLFMRLLI